ncbi:type III restriction endonuclease subunit R [Gemmatimonadetes bacterium T265]|nr:type III restriction endonuclease subunit R [Gemmatimonadetes bacterium T265]
MRTLRLRPARLLSAPTLCMPLEAAARDEIDRALAASGWLVQDRGAVNLYAGPGVAVREVPLAPGHGVADYLLYADGQAVGVVEAKRAGETLTGVEVQSEKYGTGLPAGVASPVRPLPFLYQSTGVETRFTNRLDPVPKSREVFAFHRPATLLEWATAEPLWLPVVDGRPDPRSERPATFRRHLTAMPSVEAGGLWPAQLTTVRRLEASLAAGRPRALVQMATGSGKTIAAVASIYRLLKFAGAKRVLFLVDRANLGRQALKEFQSYRTPDDGRLFTELYNVQRLTANRVDPVANVVIGTVQRLYSMLRGEPAMAEEADELDADTALDAVALGGVGGGLDALRREPVPVAYNPALPVELFDVVFVDECHRSIYTLWRQVVEYWDALLVGLTATPSKLTYGFFDANVVQEYGHEHAVADGVNVDFDVYRIRTDITERGSTVEAGQIVDRRDRETRRKRWEALDEPLVYAAAALDRDVVAPDQIRTVVRAFRDRFLPEVFPERTHIPKTLVFAKDDSHADDLVKVLRDELALGNDAVQKITYKTGTARIVERVPGPDGSEVERVTYKSSGVRPEDLLQSFRNSYHPRIAVTVDMIATGTDVKPLEVLWFMRTVRSRTLFEQMKGRGVRVVSPDDLKAVTPDAAAKTRYVIVDCVGVCEEPLADTRPLDVQPTVSLDKLLQAVAMGNVDPEVASTLASRLARLDARLGPDERASVAASTGGPTLRDLARGIVEALDPDRQRDAARDAAREAAPARVAEPGWEPGEAAVARARVALLRAALAPVAGDPQLRQRLVDLKRSKEQTIDTASVDTLLGAELSPEARDRALSTTTGFEAFLTEHRDELAAIRLLYGTREPGQARLTRAAVEELRRALLDRKPPLALDAVWRAYETLDRARVRGGPARRLSDVVALVRFATHRDDALAPLPAVARARLDAWVARMEAGGRRFTDEQRVWLAMMADHVAADVEIEAEDFDDPPFAQRGGLAGAHRVFGAELGRVLEEIGEVIAA